MFEIVRGEDLNINGLIIVLYGDPSTGKTSTALTASKPILFDFDGGAQRSGFKVGKPIVRIVKWEEIVSSLGSLEATLKDYDTIVLDTVETCLDYIRIYIEDQDYKLKTNTLKMYGKLKDEFYSFINRITKLDKTIILIAHATTEEKNGTVRTCPKITGGSKDIVRQKADFMGYLFMNNNKRTLNFNPTDFYEGKNSANFPVIELPDFKAEPEYFTKKIADMRNALTIVSADQDKALKQIETITEKIKSANSADDLHALLKEMKTAAFKSGIKAQLWEKTKARATDLGLEYHKAEEKFFPIPKAEPVPAPANVPAPASAPESQDFTFE